MTRSCRSVTRICTSIPVLMLTFTAGARAESAASSDERIAARLESLRDELVEVRRDLHRHPEISEHEERTAGIVADRLRALDLEVRTGVGGNGVVGVLRGGKPGTVVAFRADMDAVATAEPDPVSYRSETAGVRHVCGHDVHTTVGLGIAEALAAVRDDLPGAVKLLFQPAEENAKGARAMIDDGAMGEPAPRAIFAFHAAPLPVGKVGSTEGLLLPATHLVTTTLSGTGDHQAAAEASSAMLQQLTSLGPPNRPDDRAQLDEVPLSNDFVVVQPFSFEPGPGEGRSTLKAMIRTSSDEKLEQIKGQVAAGLESLALVDLAHEVAYVERTVPGATNDAELVRSTDETLRAVLGADGVVAMAGAVPFFSEDFGYFQELAPGAMYWLGVANPEKGIVGRPHSPGFTVDEEAIFVGARSMSAVLLRYLERHAP